MVTAHIMAQNPAIMASTARFFFIFFLCRSLCGTKMAQSDGCLECGNLMFGDQHGNLFYSSIQSIHGVVAFGYKANACVVCGHFGGR